jgi:SAM-dependent methyltransferase
MTNVHKRHPEFMPDQRQFFDELITEHWDAYASQEWDLARRFEIAKMFGIVRPRRILDIGCGCGFHDAEMANYPFVERVHGIDYSARSIEKADEAYPHEKVRRWAADFTDLAGQAKYDLVASFQVFEHLHNPHEYLEATKGLLAPGGAIAICTPNFDRLDNRLRRRKGMEPTLLDPQHFDEYTPDSLTRLAAAHGLKLRGWFGYDITSLMMPSLNRLPQIWRLRIGYYLPRMSRVFCMVLEPR